MARKLKCFSCQLTNEVAENMEVELIPKKDGFTKRHYHKGKCWEDRVKHKAFQEKERLELDSLYEVIKSIHKMEVIPNAFFSTCLQTLRNGDYQQKGKGKKYKKGVSFKMLEETYKHSVKKIEWARKNRTFDGSMNELKYCFAIIVDQIAVVAKKVKKEQYRQQLASEMSDNHIVEEQSAEVEYKKKETKDFSKFLD